MEKGELKRRPDEISTNILQQQLLREGLNALPEGKGSGEKGKAWRAAEPRPPMHHVAQTGQDMQTPQVPSGKGLWHHVHSFPA